MAQYALDTGGGISTPSTQQREYNNLWDVIRYGWEDLVNHPSSWGGIMSASSPGSTGAVFDQIQRSEYLDQQGQAGVLPNGDYSVDDQYVGETMPGVVDNNPAVNDANVYSRLQGDSVEDQLKWLIDNDPENASGWMEQLLGLRASRENTQQARDFEKMMSDTRIQRTAKDLEAAGINPILAYQYLNGSASSVGSASMPDSRVSTNATSKANTKATNQVASGRAIIAIVTALLAISGVALRAAL